jgi:hypothetical protein
LSSPLDAQAPSLSRSPKTGLEADNEGLTNLWTELQSRAAPVLMLRLPASASLIDVGTGNAGVGLTVADFVGEAIVSDNDVTRLERLRTLARARKIQSVRFTAAPPGQFLACEGPFDVILMLSGWCGLEEKGLLRALKPSGQLALQLTGSPGSALKASKRLLAAGFASTTVVVPWPTMATAPVAWVDSGSVEAWGTLVDRWLPNTGTWTRRGLARAWGRLANSTPNAVRHIVRQVAPTFCILGTR